MDELLCENCGCPLTPSRELGRSCPQCLLSLAMPEEESEAAFVSLPPGTTVGRYRILRLIGEGGMGAVYEAEQEHPRRTVALKIIKPGFASLELLRRFEHESVALGRLQHPGIAQIYEAGTGDTGYGPQPYFAMEFIHGETLLDYAEKHHLPTRSRLEIIARVCDAVHHAHQRGLIHRDLKPGNILVDHDGQPKVLDFGVARLTNCDTNTTLQTVTGRLVGTLAYMSPEQALADPLELDTRSDVYSLGVILYELLSARLPYTIGKQIFEALEAIRAEDPARLSSIDRSYRGDIETIVAKALEKDKERRYSSAAELAADIQRHLKDEPIVARPPSAAYQLKKFARRHKGFVSGVVAVFGVLAASVAAISWFAVGLKSERDRALQAEAKAEQAESLMVISFTARMNRDLQFQSSLPSPITVKDLLDDKASSIGTRFDKQPLVEATIRETLGDTYAALFNHPEASTQWQRALELRRREQGSGHPDTLNATMRLAIQYNNMGLYTEAWDLARQVVEEGQRQLNDDALKSAFSLLGSIYTSRYNADKRGLPEATALLANVIELERRTCGTDSSTTQLATLTLASLYRAHRPPRNAEANALLEEMRRRNGEPGRVLAVAPPEVVFVGPRGHLPQPDGEPESAEASLRSTIEKLPEMGPDRISASRQLVRLYLRMNRYQEAEKVFEDLLAAQSKAFGQTHGCTLGTSTELALVYAQEFRFLWSRGELDQALQAAERGKEFYTRYLAVSRTIPGELEGQRIRLHMAGLANVKAELGRDAESESLYKEVLVPEETARNAQRMPKLYSLAAIGWLHFLQNRLSEAETNLREAVAGY